MSIKQVNWVTETMVALEARRIAGEPMGFCLMTKHAERCKGCGIRINPRTETLGHMDSMGNLYWYCSSEHWLNDFHIV